MLKFFRDVSYIGLGLVISGFLGLMMHIFLGRFLTVEEFGVFQVFFSSLLLSGNLISFGVERDIASRISSEEKDSQVLSKNLSGFAFILILFLLISALFRNFWTSLFGYELIYFSFLFGTLFYGFYRVSMGLFKGLRKSKLIGFQNTLIGLFNLIIIILAYFFGLLALELSLALMGAYLALFLVSFYWSRGHLDNINFEMPDLSYFLNISFSTSKQLGELIILFGGPILIKIIGGTNLEAGVLAAALTISKIPYYGYRAIIHVILPEISRLNSSGELEAIGKRVNFLAISTIALIIFWSLLGYFFGPKIVATIFNSEFQIGSLSSLFAFFLGGLILLASLFTESLLGLRNEIDVAKSWLLPLPIFVLLFLINLDALVRVLIVLTMFLTLATILLYYHLVKEGISVSFTSFEIFWEEV